MYTELITIGDEILIGQIVDSNSAWMAQQLNDIGIEVKQITSVSDKIIDINNALSLAVLRADVVIMTGGLGPTNDDLTREALAEFFKSGRHIDPTVLAHIETLFSQSSRPLLDVNKKQAYVLDVAEVLFNKAGTAPGMYIQDEGKHFFVLPGVPSEMKYLMTAEVLPRLSNFPNPDVLVHKSILTAGIGESSLAMEIATIENSLPDFIQLAYLPSFGEVRLRLSAKGKNKIELLEKVKFFTDLIKEKIPNNYFSENGETLEEAMVCYLTDRNLTLSSAESCTGGNIAHLLTLVPGSSAVFMGGVVAYTNAVKEIVLGVPKQVLEEFTEVSEQTVIAMAEGIKKLLNTDYAIATTGIAGPTGGTSENPVGTVWVAIAGKTKTVVQRLSFDSIRSRTILRSSKNALILLFKLLYEENEVKSKQ